METTGELRIGILYNAHGTYAAMGADGLRGARLAVAEFDNTVAGRPIIVLEEGTTPDPQDAYYSAKRLVEEQGVDFVVGPLSANEGLAVRNYAMDHPEITFVNGSSGAPNLTFPFHAPNFFNFVLNGVQAAAGLGQYAYDKLGYRMVVSIGESYSFPFAQIGAFTLEFCRAGGKVLDRHWVPVGEMDFSDFISSIPDDVDAVMAALSGNDSIVFLEQYAATGINKPLIGGSVLVDESLPHAEGALAKAIEGTIFGDVLAADNPDPTWQMYCEAYHKTFPDGRAYPSWFAVGYYSNMKAALLAMDSINGDLSNGQQAFQEALRTISFDGPCGRIYLDEHQHIVGNNFISTVQKGSDGRLEKTLIMVNEAVDQMLGMEADEFKKIGQFGLDNPPCN